MRPLVDRFLPGRALLTLLFIDIVESTQHLVELGDEQWRMLLGRYRATVRRELARHGGHEVDTAGDSFFATFERPTSGVSCALAIRDAVDELGLQLRTGVHLGECEMRGEHVTGIEVHKAARVMAAAADGEILLSAAVRDAISLSDFPTTDRGTRELNGVPGQWQLFALEPIGQPRASAAPLLPKPTESAGGCCRRSKATASCSSYRQIAARDAPSGAWAGVSDDAPGVAPDIPRTSAKAGGHSPEILQLGRGTLGLSCC